MSVSVLIVVGVFVALGLIFLVILLLLLTHLERKRPPDDHARP